MDAVTDFKRLFSIERYSLVEARPRTGRLHQIRRHLKHITHPLIGDVKYGKGDQNRMFRERFGLNRLALHALTIEFDHPNDDRRLSLSAPLPEDLAQPLRQMGIGSDLLELPYRLGLFQSFVASIENFTVVLRKCVFRWTSKNFNQLTAMPAFFQCLSKFQPFSFFE